MTQPDQSAQPVGARRNIGNEGVDTQLRWRHRGDRFDLRPPARQVGGKRRVAMVAKIAFRATEAIGVRRIGRGRSLPASLHCLGIDAAAVRHRQGGLEREQQQQQDDEEAPDIHESRL